MAATSVITLAVLLLVGIHSAPAFAYGRKTHAGGNNTTTTQPADTSSSTDPTTTPPNSDTTDTSDATTTSSPNNSTSSTTTTDSTAHPSDPSSDTSSTPTTGTDTDPPSTPSSPDPSSGDPVTTNATVNNQTDSTSQSGDADVTDNGTAGNATSGDAQTIANLINAINSSSSLSGNGLETFDTDITGNVSGNLIIDPTQLAQPLAATTSDPSDLEFQSTNTGTINNSVDLASTSGAADVSDNGTAGNATSGSADSVANIVNLINSMITSGQSFIGEINIYGNLDGNILLPYQLVNSLVGANSAAGSTPPLEEQTDTGTLVNNTDQYIDNQVTASAASGDATVTNNGTAGNATSGNATTNVDIFNLTGSQVVGSNMLLVFVNVLGTWVGFIMNAPAGTTAAAIGGGVTQNTDTTPVPSGADISNNTTEAINNNIVVTADSGDATVSGNMVAGNATSGNASSSVNLANILGSEFSLSNWFGILFINVFGTWDGSLGVTTPPATPTPTITSPVSDSGSTVTPAITRDRPSAVFATFYSNSNTPFSDSASLVTTTTSQPQVLGILTSKQDKSSHPTLSNASTTTHSSYSFLIAMIGIFAGGILLSIERILTIRRHN